MAKSGSTTSCGSKHTTYESFDNGRTKMAFVITAVCLCTCIYAFSLMFISAKPCWNTLCERPLCEGGNATMTGSHLQRHDVANITTLESNWKPKNTSLARIVFGIAASANLWKLRKPYVKEWWKPGKMRGYVWLEEPVLNETGWGVDVPLYQISGNTSKFKYTHKVGSRSAIRLARIVTEMYRSVS